MAKISKALLKKHNETLKILKKDKLNFYEREFVYDNYHEGAGKMNNLISAHFTPKTIAQSMAQNIRMDNWVDIGAGIGRLSYSLIRENEFNFKEGYLGVCVENCVEYYNIGKKLLPECIWINGSIFDQKVINEIELIMSDYKFSIISNPPYGSTVNGSHPDLKYTGTKFEYKAIEIGAILKAYDGAFLIPQMSAPFRLTNSRGSVYNDAYKSKDYLKFLEQTGLEISANVGYDTNIISDGDIGWRDVSIITEIAILEYEELHYEPKKMVNQLSIF